KAQAEDTSAATSTPEPPEEGPAPDAAVWHRPPTESSAGAPRSTLRPPASSRSDARPTGVPAPSPRSAVQQAEGGTPSLVSLAARRWPLTQQTALGSLSGLISQHGLPDRALDGLLQAIAAMESSPVGEERSRFLDLVRAIGRDRLIEALELPDDRRLGVVRLL